MSYIQRKLCQAKKKTVSYKGQQSYIMREPRHVFEREFSKNYQKYMLVIKKTDDTAFLVYRNVSCNIIYQVYVLARSLYMLN